MNLLRTAGLRLLAFLAATAAVASGLSLDRYVRGQDRDLGQQLVIHHFERSSWFAMNAGDYERVDPELAARFREAAAWHARRAREFQRMDLGALARESERDRRRDAVEARLLEQALKYDSGAGAGDIDAPERAWTYRDDAPSPYLGFAARSWD